MPSDLESAGARAREAREEYERFLGDRRAVEASEELRGATDQLLGDVRDAREGDGRGDREPPSASPTTFSDCASLAERAGQEWALASKLGQMGYTTQAAEHASTAGDLETAAASCRDSAAGLIIEV